MHVNFIGSAKLDLRGIVQYHRSSTDQAHLPKIIQRIRRDIMSLESRVGEISSSGRVAGIHCDVIVDGMYLVFYRVQNAIEILHILHRRGEWC